MTALSSDRPSLKVEDDLFGHAPFAEQLAASIRRHRAEDGLVLALHGPWGAGKTTVLGYICHFLEASESTSDEGPIVVQFNPWWFSGREDLARAFLRQLEAVLPAKNKKFEKLGTLLGDFAEQVGGLIDLTGLTGGAGAKLGMLLGKISGKKLKDVPALKKEISKVLREAKIRILVVVDDIDRLDEGEVRQLFTVIKALADFPFVTYLLAFDREVASRAIEKDSGLPGDRYLEKIIQVPFELPPCDKVALRSALFKRLDEVLSGTPEGMFDSSYWTNVYFDGIDPLIRVPRDVVRFTNTLSVTYPGVVGEVNPVDFIAIEAMRVFLPGLYDTIRSNQERFAGHGRDEGAAGQQAAEAFHEAWANEVPEEWRASTRALMGRLFPKVGDTMYGGDWLQRWRRNARICHPDLFPIYFRLSLPAGGVGRQEMLELIESAETTEPIKAKILQAKSEMRPDGLSKAAAILEWLMDYLEPGIPDERIGVFVDALLDVGDMVTDPAAERGLFDFENEFRVTRPVYHLLKRIPPEGRAAMLESAIRDGEAIAVQQRLLASLDDEVSDEQHSGDALLLDGEEIEHLKAVWLDRIRSLSSDPEFLQHRELRRILHFWREWADEREVREWCDRALALDEALLRFLMSALQYRKSQTMGDWAIRRQPRLHPAWLEPYVDTGACYERIERMREHGQLPEWSEPAVSQFTKEYEMLSRGQDPDADRAFG